MGCGARQIPPQYYVATSTIEHTAAEPKRDEIQKVVPSAGNLLRGGNATVAFLPPSWCSDEIEEKDHHLAKEKKACIALTAALEKRAAAQGYRVVDWRLFKNDPHPVAKQEELDALFIVDDLSIHRVSMNQFRVTGIAFSKQVSATERTPTEVDNKESLTARCEGAERARMRRRLDEGEVTGATLSLKMVSAADGTAQWFYRHSENRDSTIHQTMDHYYLSEGDKKTKAGKLALGVVFTSLGVSAAVVGARLNENGTSFATRNAGFGLAWFSVLPLTVGLVMTTIGLVAQAKPPVYQSADQVVCARPPVSENPFGPEVTNVPRWRHQRLPGDTNGEHHGPPVAQRNPVGAVEPAPVIEELADHLMGSLKALSLEWTPPAESVSSQESIEAPEETSEISDAEESDLSTQQEPDTRIIITEKSASAVPNGVAIPEQGAHHE